MVMLLMSMSMTAQSYYDNVEISLLTCRSGDDLYSTFGHTALRVNDRLSGDDIVYNYGTFDFRTKGFYPKFLRGQLPYTLTRAPMHLFLGEYNRGNRSVLEQKLDLTTAQKEKLVKSLRRNIRPENAQYAYDFFHDNCTTRAIDQIKNAVDTVVYTTSIEKKTFRSILKENLGAMPWSEFGIDLIIGARADKETTRRNQHFLPHNLYLDLQTANTPKGPIVIEDQTILDFEEEDRKRKTNHFNFPLGIALALIYLELKILFSSTHVRTKLYDKTWMILMSILGLVMAFMWFGTDHTATNDNWNLLWANILFIPYMFLKRPSSKKYLAGIIALMSAIALLNGLYQFLPQYFHPAFACFAVINILKLLRQHTSTDK